MIVQTNGCFTTFRSDVSPELLNAHYQRLVETCLTTGLSVEFVYEDVVRLVKQVWIEHENTVIIKLIYIHSQLRVEVRAYEQPAVQQLKTMAKPAWWGNLKRYPNHRQLELLASAKKLGLSDYLLVDGDNCLETVIANIFYLKDGQLYTPKLNEYILDGLTRREIITNFNVVEYQVKLNEIYNADLVFSCNGGRGLAFIDKIDDQEYNLKYLNNQVIADLVTFVS